MTPTLKSALTAAALLLSAASAGPVAAAPAAAPAVQFDCIERYFGPLLQPVVNAICSLGS